MSDQERDSKLNRIAQELLEIDDLNLEPDMEEVVVYMVDLKQALQLAYKFGQDSIKKDGV